MHGSYLGPEYGQASIEATLTAAGAEILDASRGRSCSATAQALADGKAVGWMQGRMEFGPRALGARSILGDPRSPTMQKTLNLKVKYRESFRPFAPSVLREEVGGWFELDADSPYMLLVAPVRSERQRAMSEDERLLFGIDKLNVSRSEIPAVTHVDYSARVQTVHKETNPLYHALISRFRKLTGCPVLINTSSTCVASLSCARHRTPSAASWAARSMCWLSVTACCAKKTRTPSSSSTTRAPSSWIEFTESAPALASVPPRSAPRSRCRNRRVSVSLAC